LHVHGRGAKTTDACGLIFAMLSTQVSTGGLRLRQSRLACGSILEVSRDVVAAGEEQQQKQQRSTVNIVFSVQ
jgi:hypothetical protein